MKHVDRAADFHESMGWYSHLVRPKSCVIDAELITHLPHHVQHTWPEGINEQGHTVRSPNFPACMRLGVPSSLVQEIGNGCIWVRVCGHSDWQNRLVSFHSCGVKHQIDISECCNRMRS